MTLTIILLLAAAAIPYATLLPAKARGHVLLALSILALYLLQPPLPIRFADFLLPTLSLFLAVAGWVWTRDLRFTIDDLRLREKGTRIDTVGTPRSDEHGSKSGSLSSPVSRLQSLNSFILWDSPGVQPPANAFARPVWPVRAGARPRPGGSGSTSDNALPDRYSR